MKIKVLCFICSHAYYKRDLPHAHLLIFLHPTRKTAKEIDRVMSIEIVCSINNRE